MGSSTPAERRCIGTKADRRYGELFDELRRWSPALAFELDSIVGLRMVETVERHLADHGRRLAEESGRALRGGVRVMSDLRTLSRITVEVDVIHDGHAGELAELAGADLARLLAERGIAVDGYAVSVKVVAEG